MNSVIFHPSANLEMMEAAKYYEKQQEDLGQRFLLNVQKAVKNISFNPFLYAFIDSESIKCRVEKFPFGIVFRLKNRKIEIIAIPHFKRKPNYWKNRL